MTLLFTNCLVGAVAVLASTVLLVALFSKQTSGRSRKLPARKYLGETTRAPECFEIDGEISCSTEPYPKSGRRVSISALADPGGKLSVNK